MIKWSIISICVIGILLTWVLTSVILDLHSAHGYSVVREFEQLELIDRSKLEELKKEPLYKDFSLYQRVQGIGATNRYFGVLRVVLSCVFVAIAMLALAIPKPSQVNGRSAKGEESKE